MATETLRDFQGRILGTIETDSNGNKIGRTFMGRMAGRYRADLNQTMNWRGWVLGSGDFLASVVIECNAKDQKGDFNY